MKGWKTWAAAIAVAILGVIDIINGDTPNGIEKLPAAWPWSASAIKLKRG